MAVDIANLHNCVNHVGPPPGAIPQYNGNFKNLVDYLESEAVRNSLPEAYQLGVLNPFISFLKGIGEANFDYIYQTSSNILERRKEGYVLFLKQIIPDVYQAITQNHQGYADHASNAFQEVVSDLYDGYLSDADRAGTKKPDKGTLPPLVKWASPNEGPYTWTISATEQLGLKCPIVSLPSDKATGGLLGWSTLGHETGGHDILHADTGLLDELSSKVYAAVNNKYNEAFAEYWKNCTDEAASDVLGLLNMGPAAGIGLVGYFRSGSGSLRTTGSLQGPHPVDIMRGFIAAQIVSQLAFDGSQDWSNVIEQETVNDLGNRQVQVVDMDTRARYNISHAAMIDSAKLVARTISLEKLHSLEGHSLIEIQDWSNTDQLIADYLGDQMEQGKALHEAFESHTFYATHVVAGAVTEALKDGGDVDKVFAKMKEFLNTMHNHNETWQKTWEGSVSLHGRPVSMHKVQAMDPPKGGEIIAENLA